MDSSFRNADMLQLGLVQFYSQAIQKQTFKSCQVPRNTKKKKKSVKVTDIIMQSTANAVFRKNKKQNQLMSLFIVRGLAIGKNIIMRGCFLATNLFLIYLFFINGNCGF